MITVRKSLQRGTANYGWLQARYSFSFSDYFDPDFMGFSVLRVINEDRLAPHTGFPSHGHKDMEIITYILDGVLEHKDNLGNIEQLKPGEIQAMTAGKGVMHSEYNPSPQETHLLQIWIETNQRNHRPNYQQKNFGPSLTSSLGLTLLVSPDGSEGSLPINQDIKLYSMKKIISGEINYVLPPYRKAWIQVASGNINLNHVELQAGDGAAIEEENLLKIHWDKHAEFLLFDLP